MQNISVLFVDVRGFTTLSERLSPPEIVERLNPFYWLSAEVVFRLDGTLDKLVGDEVMAFFGAPFEYDDHPQRAIEAGLQILEGVAGMGGDELLSVGAGIATGEAFVGNVGPDTGEVRDFTAIGDTVNVAARLQAEAAPGEILVTEEAYASVSHRFSGAPTRELQLRGRSQPVTVRVLTPSSPRSIP